MTDLKIFLKEAGLAGTLKKKAARFRLKFH